MATTTIVITDTRDGRIKTLCDYRPKRGEPPTPAQEAALKILERTRREYGLPEPEIKPEAIHMPACPKCGSNSQVWKNQITGVLTCHRAYCDTQITTAQAANAEADPPDHHPV